ncbi:MAG: DUF167 domain-containing protein [Candidatus Nanoarchaeia archaeon]
MRIQIKVYPNAKEQKIIKGDIWKIYVKAPAKDGKANKELVKLLNKENAKLVKGFKSRNKVIEI